MHAALADAANLAPNEIDLENSAMSALLRLKKRSEFLAANRAAKSVTDSLILQKRHRKDDSCAIRVGFTASKKVGNAVVRNRAKRRMRSLAFDLLKTRGKKGHDYVLIARNNATVECSYDILKRDLHSALERVSKMKRR